MSRPAGLDPARTFVDLLFALVLTAGALAGWATTYDGSRWFVVGLTGAGVAVGLAIFLASRGFGLDLLLLLTIPLYLLSAGPVSSATRIGDRMFEDVIAGTASSWTLLVGTHPPVDGNGVLLLPPYLVGLLVGALSMGIALRSRSPGAPVAAPLVAMAAVLMLGRHEPVWLLGQSLGFGAVALVWVLLRGLRLDVPARPAALVPRLVAAAVVLAVAAALAGPVADRSGVLADERLVLREVVPTYDVREVTTPLAQFRRFTQQAPGVLGNVHDSRLFRVHGLPEGTRLRFLALDTYDQTRFRPGDKTVPGRYDDRFLRIGSAIDNPATGKEVFVNVDVTKYWDNQWVPTAGAVQWFGFDGRRATTRVKGFRYNPATATALMTSDLTDQDSYEFATILTDDTLTRRMQPSPLIDLDLFITAKFVDIPAHAWSAGARSPMDAVFRAAETMRRTGRYSDGAAGFEVKYLPGHDRARIGPQFIHGSLTGNDEQYATVMALVATRLGVPARVVVGAVVPRSGVVRGKDVEAWVELRIADGSWRTLPTDLFMSHRPPGQQRFDENPDPNIKLPGGLTQQPNNPPPPKQQPSPSLRGQAPIGNQQPPWWPWALLTVALGVAGVPALKALRRRRRARHPRVTRRYAGAWLELVDQARDLGNPVPAGLTRQDQAARVGRGEELAWAADRAIFGIDEPDPADAAAYWTLVEEERRALRAAASRRDRVLALVHPGSLHPSRSGRNAPTKWQESTLEAAEMHTAERP